MEHSETNNDHNDEGQKISETTEVKKVVFNNCLHINLFYLQKPKKVATVFNTL